MFRIIKIAVITIIALCASCASISAKGSKADIKGKVIEKSNNQPLAYATVTVKDANDNIVTGTTTKEDGIFDFTSIVDGNYKLIISFIGYKDVEINIDSSEKNIDLGNITIEQDSEMLKAAVVTAKVPLIEQKLDKIVMNVSESVMATTSNGFELLKKAPGISVDTDGNIYLNGKSVDIWIDNRPSRLSGSQLESLLSALDGNTIEKIEIMQHPSAKYDASGSNGIINIKTKKHFINGLYGDVSLTYYVAPKYSYAQMLRASGNINYRSKKSNTYFTYTPYTGKNYSTFESNTLYGDNYNKQDISKSKLSDNETSHYIKLGNDFYINDKNTVGFLVATNFSNENFDSKYSTIESYVNNAFKESTSSIINQPGSMNRVDANLYYTKTFSPASDLTFNLDYDYFDFSNGSKQINTHFNPDGNNLPSYNPANAISKDGFDDQTNRYLNIFSAKVDYKQPILKKGMIEMGAKWTETQTKNNQTKSEYYLDEFVEMPHWGTKFNYTEDIIAAYASASYQINPQWSAVLGLRGEYTHSKGNWISSNKITKKNYFDVFPTVYIGYMPSEKWRLSASYTIRINRPGFSQLNPYKVYIDANSSITGNPDLQPEYTHQVTLAAGYGSHFNFALLYQQANDLISQDPTFDNVTGEKQIEHINFGKFTLVGANLSISELPLVKERLFLTANMFVSNAKSTSKTDDYNQSKVFAQGYGALTAVLPANFKFELSGNYMSGLPHGYLDVKSQWLMSAGVKKSFLNDKATLSLYVNDLFGTSNSKIEIYDSGKLIYSIKQGNSYNRNIKLGFSYKFGKVQGKRRTNKRDDTSSRANGSSSGINL